MRDPELILSFDTATTICTVALTCGGFVEGRVLGALSFDSGVTHSKRLLSSIDWLLDTVAVKLDDLAAIAVGLGPGSFTGLRIGLAAAKGLCHASTTPLIGISSLDAVAASLLTDKLICVVMDARKHEVYSCLYRAQASGVPRRYSEPMVSTPQKLAEMLDEPVLMAGDGADVYSEIFTRTMGDKLTRAPARYRYPEAVNIGFLAADEYRRGNQLELDQAGPHYVRFSDAELSLVSPLKTGPG